MTDSMYRVPIEPQSIVTPLSKASVFLVLKLDPAAQALTRAIEVISDIGGLTRAVGFRDLHGRLSCNVGIGSDAWDRLRRPLRPAQLRRFAEIRGPVHTAPATGGDLLFHIRAERPDMCFDLERMILQALGDCVTVADEVQGFLYFDSRDLLGFVDGTENPTGSAIGQSALIQSDDAPFEGGSYVVVQKYLHRLDRWQALDSGAQEALICRSKVENVELEDAPGLESHKTLTTIVDEHGVEHDMLHNMFVGGKPGRHDRILDFSTAITGSTFFAPSNSMLMTLAG